MRMDFADVKVGLGSEREPINADIIVHDQVIHINIRGHNNLTVRIETTLLSDDIKLWVKCDTDFCPGMSLKRVIDNEDELSLVAGRTIDDHAAATGQQR